MIRKPNFMSIIFLSMLIMFLSLNANAKSRGGGISGLPFGYLAVKLGSAISGASLDFTPVVESHGVLSLKVTTQDAEMYIDDRLIGLVKDFKGPAVVSVPSGDHVVEFRYNGLSYTTKAYVVRGHTTSVVYTFKKSEPSESF